MNRLVSHIEFLLHEYNCVIIPDFGGFVVNAIHSRIEDGNVLHAPTCELVFNRDLTYNDGLMAQSYMSTYNLSFDSATLEIEKGVRDLKHRLHDHRHVELGQLGSFTMHDDKRFVYTPSPFTRPAFFGLTKAMLKPLVAMQPKVVPLNREVRQKRIRVASMSAAAAAIIAVMLLIFPMSDTTTGRQSAQMLSETEWFRSKPAPSQQHTTATDQSRLEAITEEAVPTAHIVHEEARVPASDAANTSAINEEASLADDEALHKYYIVMGVFTGNATAQKMTDELEGRGFTSTGWLERPGRIDVYAASFTDEAAAKVYLREIHGQYPAYSDAWILKR